MKRPGRSSSSLGESLKTENLEASTTKKQLDTSSSASSAHNETTDPNSGDSNPSQHLDHTSETLQHQCDQRIHTDYHRTRDCAIGRGKILPVNNFHDEYLRKCKDYRKNKSDIYWNKFKEALSESRLESDLYSIIVKFLTEMCIAVCKPRTLLFAADIAGFTDTFLAEKNTDKCLAAYIVADMQVRSEYTEGSDLRPDIIFKWTTYACAKQILSAPIGKVDTPAIHWADVVSYVRVERERHTNSSSAQAHI